MLGTSLGAGFRACRVYKILGFRVSRVYKVLGFRVYRVY